MSLIAIDLNSNAVERLLREAPDALADAWDATINDASARLLLELKTYPPQRSGSTYIRRNNLKRSWSRQFAGSGLGKSVAVGSNENMAPYNREVQDAERQARVHRGRWTNTVQAVAARNERPIGDLFQQRVDAAVRRLGG